MKKPVILCVDDEQIIVDALKEQLNRNFGNDFDIETSESGDDAFEYFKELHNEATEIPVVIADYLMPGMKGDKLLAEIHKLSPETHNILLTGQANIEGVANAVNYADLYRYIGKPWDHDDLVMTIKEAVRLFRLEKKLKKQNNELAELNASLERKVDIRTKQLSELNATKDKFFSIIAHDLKNPFNTLLGFSRYMVENFDSISETEKKEYLTAIRDTADHGFKLLENLLEWSRAQTGRITWEPDDIFMSALVSETVDIMTKAAENKNINILSFIPEKVKAYGDENMVKTVLRNLISNGIKYSHSGSRIVLSCKNKNDELVFSVQDFGIGISDEHRKKLFNLDSSFTTKGTDNEIGTGLGLILCKEFIERNNGRIWVESEPEKGATFYFSLPATKEPLSNSVKGEKATSGTR